MVRTHDKEPACNIFMKTEFEVLNCSVHIQSPSSVSSLEIHNPSPRWDCIQLGAAENYWLDVASVHTCLQSREPTLMQPWQPAWFWISCSPACSRNA
jgi:hypothetical protein